MTKKQIRKLAAELRTLKQRAGGVKARELVAFAERLGRRRANRGKEPTYLSILLPGARPISIPGHSGDLKKGTTLSILDDLRTDLDRLKEIATKEGGDNGDDVKTSE
jgi:hypothetical protein